MSILQITTDFAGEIAVAPRIVRIVATDAFNAITTAGYLNERNTTNQGIEIDPTDFIFINYDDGAEFGIFTPSINAGIITLEPYVGQGDVTLPVVSGDFAVFDGTTGTIKDASYSPSNAAKTKVVMANAATVANNMATFADTAGTVKDAGARIISGTTTTYAGGGTSNAFTVAGLTATCVGTANILTSTNSVSVNKVVPSTNTLTITFSADPGAGTTLNYNFTTAALT